MPDKYISYDYLYGKRDAFPFVYRLVFEKILEDAPGENEHQQRREEDVETNIYDQEELFSNCTVQVLTNSVTGEVSVGWWENDNPPAENEEKSK